MGLLARGFLCMLGLLCYCTQIRQVVVSEMLVTIWNLKSLQTFILPSIKIYHIFNGKTLNSILYWCTQTRGLPQSLLNVKSTNMRTECRSLEGHLTIRVAPAPWPRTFQCVEVPLCPFCVWGPRWEPPSSSHSWEYRLQNLFMYKTYLYLCCLCVADSLAMDSTRIPPNAYPHPWQKHPHCMRYQLVSATPNPHLRA